MNKDSIAEIVSEQKEYFLSNQTKNLEYRYKMLVRLKKAIQKNEDAICQALYLDLGKSKSEAYMAEIAMVYHELNYAIKNIYKWGKPERVKGTIITFPAKNYVYAEPYGTTLVLAPWNYPFNLSITPLVGAMAAGNTVVLKCSKTSKHTARVIKKMLDENFDRNYICCLDANSDYDAVLEHKYDYIFFTGSPNVGKQIMRIASEELIPVS